MYLEHFKLRQAPFSLTPDPAYFYNYTGHQLALNVLLVAIKGGDGLIKIIGKVGTGKTLLCRRLH
jgi:MSHA biogenesis protein MshM